MKRSKYFDEIEACVAGVFIMVMLVVGTLNVIMRYLFHNSMTWSEEFMRYALVWFAYISAAYAVTKRMHVTIDAMSEVVLKGHRRAGKIVQFVGKLIWLGVTVYVTYLGILETLNKVRLGQVSAGMGIPLWILYVAIPVCFGLMALRLVQVLIQDLRSIRNLSASTEVKEDGTTVP